MMQWISVKDRLPEDDGKYLCCTRSGAIVVVKYHHFRDTGRWRTYESVAQSITHWMPLPEPPKE